MVGGPAEPSSAQCPTSTRRQLFSGAQTTVEAARLSPNSSRRSSRSKSKIMSYAPYRPPKLVRNVSIGRSEPSMHRSARTPRPRRAARAGPSPCPTPGRACRGHRCGRHIWLVGDLTSNARWARRPASERSSGQPKWSRTTVSRGKRRARSPTRPTSLRPASIVATSPCSARSPMPSLSRPSASAAAGAPVRSQERAGPARSSPTRSPAAPTRAARTRRRGGRRAPRVRSRARRGPDQ